MATLFRWEQQPVFVRVDELLEMRLDGGQQVRRDLDVAAAGVRFWCGGLKAFLDAHDRALDAHGPVRLRGCSPLAKALANSLSVGSTMMTSFRRSSVSSPNRSAHHAASNTIAWYCSGISVVMVAISSSDAGRILWTRRALPAPRITHGLALILPSLSAVPMMVRSSP